MIEILFILLGVIVGYNIRHERELRKEYLVLEKVDTRLRRDLEIAKNLNDSLSKDVAGLKDQLSVIKTKASPKAD
jgi:hypothetical protein